MEVALLVRRVLVLQDVLQAKVVSDKLFSSAQVRRVATEVHLGGHGRLVATDGGHGPGVVPASGFGLWSGVWRGPMHFRSPKHS